MAAITKSTPTTKSAPITIHPGELPTLAQLLQQTGLVASLSEARRTVKEGGAYLNNERVSDADAVPPADLCRRRTYLLLTQHPDDLLFFEPAFPHRPSSDDGLS